MNSSAAPAQDQIEEFLARYDLNGEFLQGIKSLSAKEVLGDMGTLTIDFIKMAGFPHLANRDSLLEIWRRLR